MGKKVAVILAVLIMIGCGVVLANEGALEPLVSGNGNSEDGGEAVDKNGDEVTDDEATGDKTVGETGDEATGDKTVDESSDKAGYENGDGGPPPWAPAHARERWQWAQSGESGPPPWAPAHARERWQWAQSGESGPPPWAGPKTQCDDCEQGSEKVRRTESGNGKGKGLQ